MGRLAGKIAIVTGSNSGIGEATAKLFAAEGATVIITARRERELERVAQEIRDKGGSVDYIAGDITQTEDINRVVDETVQRHGRIDILVNNAGMGDKHRSTLKLSDDWMDLIIDVNLKGTLRFCRAALRHMVEVDSGVIVNVSSIGGVYGCAGAAYSAAKSGVIALTTNLGIQYYGTGIRANCVSPGGTETPLLNPDNFKDADVEMLKLTKRIHVNEYEQRMSPEKLASAILFFASDDSSCVNGQNLVVDRGMQL